ncbi:outer membrane beta-barrel protein [uncultured Mailhella sp.]|mgnify:FL=1|uniref:outer membrane protein n=1 Tax=uncultured Mailhella sp. TaxID=1981031 RepID=UPI0025EAEF9A|nr:outer membrane beta-barrel protein [uncultured Mailhella sp.]
MFKKFGMLLMAACLLLPVQAKAADLVGVYIAPKFVLNVQHSKGELSYHGQGLGSDSKTGARAGGALAVGYDFNPVFSVPVRAELEYGAYGRISKTEGDGDHSFHAKVGLQTLLANAYWDITTWNGFTPYIGAGLGMAFLKTEGHVNHTRLAADLLGSNSDTDTVFAGQVGLGCSYAFTDNLSADIGYRFLMMDNGNVTGIVDGMNLKSKDNYVHQFMMGLRVTF